MLAREKVNGPLAEDLDASSDSIVARLARLQQNGVSTGLDTSPIPQPSPNPSLNGAPPLKVPRKRPVPSLHGGSNGSSAYTLGSSSPGYGSSPPQSERPVHSPHPLPLTPGAQRKSHQVKITKEISFPKANLIEPKLLHSYLALPEGTRPSILLLDVRPKELYDRGCLNAECVVWIDPILL